MVAGQSQSLQPVASRAVHILLLLPANFPHEAAADPLCATDSQLPDLLSYTHDLMIWHCFSWSFLEARVTSKPAHMFNDEREREREREIALRPFSQPGL